MYEVVFQNFECYRRITLCEHHVKKYVKGGWEGMIRLLENKFDGFGMQKIVNIVHFNDEIFRFL